MAPFYALHTKGRFSLCKKESQTKNDTSRQFNLEKNIAANVWTPVLKIKIPLSIILLSDCYGRLNTESRTASGVQAVTA